MEATASVVPQLGQDPDSNPNTFERNYLRVRVNASCVSLMNRRPCAKIMAISMPVVFKLYEKNFII